MDNKPNYKVYYFKDSSKCCKVVIERFYAENDDAAYAHLEEVKKTHLELTNELYYATLHYVSIVDENGNRTHEVDIDDHRKWLWLNRSNVPLLKKILEEVKDFFAYWLVEKPKDIYYWTRDLVYLLKNKEAYSNQWNLDWHILDSIERNVPSLIKNSHSLAFINEAVIQAHKDVPEFDLDEYNKEHCCGYPKEIEELAMKIQKEEYANLLLHVKLYKYYANFGIVDFDDPEQAAFDKEWRHTLPVKKGTYDEISDYNELLALSKEHWDKIWDWMKAYGEKLND